MNLYHYIKYKLLRFKKPVEFKAGQVWQRNTRDPFDKSTIDILDVKDGYVQYMYTDGCSKFSDSEDLIRYLYHLISQGK